MTDDPDLELGAGLSRLLAVIVERESPILRALGLSMWEHVILSRLQEEDGLPQATLAERSRRDPTRLIGHLDDLEARGLVTRVVDPADRRRRLVRLTPAGSAAVAAARRAIRAMEDDLLSPLGASEQRSLRRSLAALLAASD